MSPSGISTEDSETSPDTSSSIIDQFNNISLEQLFTELKEIKELLREIRDQQLLVPTQIT